MGMDKPRPEKIHVDLKRSSSIARMSNEKISPTSARRRYERRKVIIRSKSGDEAPSPTSQPSTIKEMERETSSSSLDKIDTSSSAVESGAGAVASTECTDETSQESSQGMDASALERERVRSKSEGGQEQRTSYKETFEESTRDDAIQKVLDQAHQTLLKKPPPDGASPKKKTRFVPGAGAEGSSAQGTSHKRRKNHGSSHPLAKLTASARKHPFYSTM